MKAEKKYSLAYIILTYPKKSEQFIVREVMALARYFGPILVYSLKKGEYALPDDPNIKIMYLEDNSFWKAVYAHVFLFRKFPSRYISTLFKYILSPYLKTLTPKGPLPRRRRAAKKTRRYLKSVIIASDIIKKKASHIHAHYAHRPAETAMRISCFTGVPFSFSAHAKDLFLTRESKVVRLVKKSAFVLTCTQDGEAYLKEMCRKKYHNKINCVYHGLPLSSFVPGHNNDEAAKEPVILSAGRFIDKKGFDTLLLSLSILKKRGKNFRCIIAGDGQLVGQIKKLVDTLNLGQNVEFPGFLSEGALAELYQKSTLFALACRKSPDGNKDGIPNVILEAMASGLPVVSTNIGGVPEVIKDRKNGFLQDSNAPEAFADSIESLINDKDLRERMGKKGRDLVIKRFDIEKNSEKLFRLFLKHSENLRLTFHENKEIDSPCH